MQIEILKRWGWRGGQLTPGQILVMPPKTCQVLIERGVAREVRVAECATIEPEQAAVTQTPKRRRARKNAARPAS